MDRRTYTYKVVGGCEIRADVYGADGAVRPVLLWLHGGALMFGRRTGLSAAQCRRYVQAGYIVVSMDYRLAPETSLPEIVQDVRDACAWVRRSGPALFDADPDRLAVVGHSAGGYLALMSGFAVDPPPQALASFYGYGDITGAWYSRPDRGYCRQPLVTEQEARAAVGTTPISESAEEARFRLYLYCRQRGLWPRVVAGHDPDAEPAAFGPYCPVRNVSPSFPPTLLLHGDQDTDVPCEQSVLMARELARHGIDHEMVVIPGAEHGFDYDESAAGAALDRVLRFLGRHIPPSHWTLGQFPCMDGPAAGR